MSLAQIRKNGIPETNNKNVVSLGVLSRLVGVCKSSLHQALNPKLETASGLQRYLSFKKVDSCNWNTTGIPTEAAAIIVFYYGYELGNRCRNEAKEAWTYYQQNKHFQSFQHFKPNNVIPTTQHNPEKLASDRLLTKLDKKDVNYRVEVSTPAGRIDILTDTEVIEVKQFRSWKEAIGQLIIYGVYYPTHKRRMHLFGKIDSKLLLVIRQHCAELNIRVTWDS